VAACRDYRAKVEAYATVDKHAVMCWYEPYWHEELVLIEEQHIHTFWPTSF